MKYDPRNPRFSRRPGVPLGPVLFAAALGGLLVGAACALELLTR